MTQPTREQLLADEYRQRLAMPAHLSWTEADLERSMYDTLASRVPGPLWVFAYGSLIWNPLMRFASRRVATLVGWQRSFCLRTIAARGTPETPGRVLAIEPGGTTQGVAYELSEDNLLSELRLLWRREMLSGDYRPTWASLIFEDSAEGTALVFVVNPEQPLYEPDASAETVARLACRAAGAFGSNADYIHSLHEALTDMGLSDSYVSAVVECMKMQSGVGDGGQAPSGGALLA